MNKFTILFGVLSILVFGSFSSITIAEECYELEWAVQYGSTGSDNSTCLALDDSGNIFICGFTTGDLGGSPASLNDVFLAKYNSAGLRLWLKKFGSSGVDRPASMSVDSSGNIYICGSIDNNYGNLYKTGSEDAFLVKYDTNGNRLWMKQHSTLGKQGFTSLEVDINDNIIASASNWSSPFMVKYDFSGNQIWLNYFNQNSRRFGGFIATDSSCNIINSYYVHNLDSEEDVYTSKYDSKGNLLWEKELTTNVFDRPLSVTVDDADNIIVCGYTKGNLDGTNVGEWDSFIAKYTKDGDLEWIKQIGTLGNDYFSSVKTDRFGNIFACGVIDHNFYGNFSRPNNGHIVKYDAAGNQLWSKEIGTNHPERIQDIDVGYSGGIIVCGETKGDLFAPNRSSSFDAFLMKLISTNVAPIADAGSDLHLSADGECGASFILDGSGSYDEDGDELAYYWFYNGELFGEGMKFETVTGLGEFVFTLIVNDGTEDSLQDEVVVKVIDNTPPQVNVTMKPSIIWPPNNKLVKVAPIFEAFDNCSEESTVELLGITCSQESDTDIEITDEGIFLRALRNAKIKEDRVYTVTYKITDGAGNETITSAEVKVPYDFRRSTANLTRH